MKILIPLVFAILFLTWYNIPYKEKVDPASYRHFETSRYILDTSVPTKYAAKYAWTKGIEDCYK